MPTPSTSLLTVAHACRQPRASPLHLARDYAQTELRYRVQTNNFLSTLRELNPSMRHAFFAISAFLRPPRLTLDRLLWSHMSPSRLMLGGGGEKGSGAGGRAQGGLILS